MIIDGFERDIKILMGWLTPSLIHELNNALTAIRGSIQLSSEVLDDPNELASYLELCHQETNRIVGLLACLQTLYRPMKGEPAIPINQMVQQLTSLAARALRRNGVDIHLDNKLIKTISSPEGFGLLFLYIIQLLGEHLNLIQVSSMDIEASAHHDVEIKFSYPATQSPLPEQKMDRKFMQSIFPTAIVKFQALENRTCLHLVFPGVQEGA